MTSTLTKIEDLVICRNDDYNSFPNIVKRQDGSMVAVFRQAPDRRRTLGHNLHIDPSSRAVSIASNDGGKTWSAPSVLYDDFLYGIQDPCLNLLSDGTLFCTFFTWQVLLPEDVPAFNPATYDRRIGGKWVGRLGGAYSIRSTDGGATWDDPLPITSPAGGVQARNVRGNAVELEDGTILLPMYVRTPDSSSAVLAVTRDRGRTWEQRSVIADTGELWFHEPNLYRTPSGKLIALLRTTDRREGVSDERRHPLYTCESYDNGLTWSIFTGHPIYSPSPFHLLRLASGRTLLTYGYRLPPYGIRALILNSECTDWETAPETIVRVDGPNKDIGYTCSVQADNGDIVVMYYYADEPGGLCYIAASRLIEYEH